MAKAIHIEERTIEFIKAYKRMKAEGEMPAHKELAKILDIPTISTISEILGKRQNISPDSWKNFKVHFGISDKSEIQEVRFIVDHDKLIVEMLKEMIKISAKVDTLSITIADIVAKVDKKAIASVDAELIDATNRRAEALLDEWKKKVSGL